MTLFLDLTRIFTKIIEKFKFQISFFMICVVNVREWLVSKKYFFSPNFCGYCPRKDARIQLKCDVKPTILLSVVKKSWIFLVYSIYINFFINYLEFKFTWSALITPRVKRWPKMHFSRPWNISNTFC